MDTLNINELKQFSRHSSENMYSVRKNNVNCEFDPWIFSYRMMCVRSYIRQCVRLFVLELLVSVADDKYVKTFHVWDFDQI